VVILGTLTRLNNYGDQLRGCPNMRYGIRMDKGKIEIVY